MGPLSIVAACTSLAATIGTTGVQNTQFAIHVQEARNSMAVVQSELASLNICLASLENDAGLHAKAISQQLAENVLAIIKNYDALVCEISALLAKMGTASLARKT